MHEVNSLKMSMPSEDIKLEMLNDHYKDSFAYLQSYIKIRDKLFILILITITVMLYQIYTPVSNDVLESFIANQMDIDKSSVDISFVSSVIWFALLALSLRYFQTIIHIERQYKYVHCLETSLNNFYPDEEFTREGRSYLDYYPLFSKWAWILYTKVFPILLIFIVLLKIIDEINFVVVNQASQVFNILISISIITTTLLYIYCYHRKR